MPRGYVLTPDRLTRRFRRIARHRRSHTAAQTAERFGVSLATVEEARQLMERAEYAGRTLAQRRAG